VEFTPVVFSGFSAEALADRVNDCGAKILITADGSFRRGKPVAIKDNADRAIPKCPTSKKSSSSNAQVNKFK
jgi:acetyl-CoA synthetase